MPTSELSAAPAVVFKALENKPKAILDCGVGFGKYGVLLREYSDVLKGNYAPYSWKTIIDGVEVFTKYRNPVWNVYSNVYNCDVRNFKPKRKYDVVLFCDILEHLPKKQAFALIDGFLKFGTKRIIVTTPRGFSKQHAWGGNKAEMHRSGFLPQDFKKYGVEYAASFGPVFMVTIDAKKKGRKK